jgi:hypothetical protein
VPLAQPRPSFPLVGPPWYSCQAFLPSHTRRVRFAVAWLGASPTGFTVRRGSFLPCSSVTRALSKSLRICADREDADPSAPPNTPCTRPPCWRDFSRQPVPTAHSVYRVALVGRRVMFTVGQAAFLVSGFRSAAQRRLHQQRAYTAVPLIKPRPSSSLVDPQWHSSQPLRVPHPRRACLPSLAVALRPWLHGVPRLILAVPARDRGAAKVVAADVCRPRSCHPGRPAQHPMHPTALSLRFFILACADRSWRLTPLYSTGGRLSFTVRQLPSMPCLIECPLSRIVI